MEEKEILAKNLTFYRKQCGLSQLDVAQKLNYSNKNISKWEKGETIPNAFILSKISKIYGVTIEDLLSENQNEIKIDEENIEPKKNIRKTIFRLTMLILANAILYALGTSLIYAINLANIDGFNIWLIYLYLSPLSFLSINIYIRVLYKYVDIISLSLFGWLICLSVYLSLFHIPEMSFIFALGGAYEIIAICIALLINIKILNHKPNLKKLFNKKNDA